MMSWPHRRIGRREVLGTHQSVALELQRPDRCLASRWRLRSTSSSADRRATMLGITSPWLDSTTQACRSPTVRTTVAAAASSLAVLGAGARPPPASPAKRREAERSADSAWRRPREYRSDRSAPAAGPARQLAPTRRCRGGAIGRHPPRCGSQRCRCAPGHHPAHRRTTDKPSSTSRPWSRVRASCASPRVSHLLVHFAVGPKPPSRLHRPPAHELLAQHPDRPSGISSRPATGPGARGSPSPPAPRGSRHRPRARRRPASFGDQSS